jgi:FkbM family methyltransferase
VVIRNDVLQLRASIEAIRPGDVVLDVGAHLGQFAVLFAALVGPHGRVVSFEPDRDAHRTLRANIVLNAFGDRVTIEPVAVYDRTGEHAFYSGHANSQSSLAATGLTSGDPRAPAVPTLVRTVTIDDYLGINGLPAPRFVKIDIEGAEIHALRGATRVLESDAIILCELHPYAWPELNIGFDDLLAITGHYGKSMRFLDESLRIQDGPSYGAVLIR